MFRFAIFVAEVGVRLGGLGSWVRGIILVNRVLVPAFENKGPFGSFGIIDAHVDNRGLTLGGVGERFFDAGFDLVVVGDRYEAGSGGFGDARKSDVAEDRARLAVVGDLLPLRDLDQLAVVENEEGDTES